MLVDSCAVVSGAAPKMICSTSERISAASLCNCSAVDVMPVVLGTCAVRPSGSRAGL